MKMSEKFNTPILLAAGTTLGFILALSFVPVLMLLPSDEWLGFYGSIAGGLAGGMTTLIAAWFAWRGIVFQTQEQKRAMAFPFVVKEYEAICARLPETLNIKLASDVILKMFNIEKYSHNETRRAIFNFLAKKPLSEGDTRKYPVRNVIEQRYEKTDGFLRSQFISALEFLQNSVEINVDHLIHINADDGTFVRIEELQTSNAKQCQYAMKRLQAACSQIAESADRDDRRSHVLKNEIDAVLGEFSIGQHHSAASFASSAPNSGSGAV